MQKKPGRKLLIKRSINGIWCAICRRKSAKLTSFLMHLIPRRRDKMVRRWTCSDSEEMLKALAKACNVELLPDTDEEIHWVDEPPFNNFMTCIVIFAVLFLGISLDY